MYYRRPDEFFIEVVSVEDLDIIEEGYRSDPEPKEINVQDSNYLELDSIEVDALEESDDEYVDNEINKDAKLV